MSTDIQEAPVEYKLRVQNTLIPCSKRVISSSAVLLDMMDLVRPDDDSPIPIPQFITRQIILDWVEMVEKGDWECAHLVLVSLSYLLDFLIAVDFLGCERIKASVEDKIREKIDETNWREILSYTKDIIGLENTTKAALEHVMKALAKYYHDTDLSKEPANEEEGEGDPYLAEYSRMSAPIVKLMLRSLASASQMVKMHVIRQWVAANTLYHVQVRSGVRISRVNTSHFAQHRAGVFELLKCVELKEFTEAQMKTVTDQVRRWPLSEEQQQMFTQMVDTAKREKTEEADKRKKFRSCRFESYQEWREHRRSILLGVLHHHHVNIHLHGPGPGPEQEPQPGPAPPPELLMEEQMHMQMMEEEEMFNNDNMFDIAGGPDVWLDLP